MNTLIFLIHTLSFEKLSRAVKILDTVKLMKKVVPEFKSKNSPKFEVLDKE